MMEVKFGSSFMDEAPDEEEERQAVTTTLEGFIREAVTAIMSTVPDFVKRVEVESDGDVFHCVPVVSPNGVVVRLNLSDAHSYHSSKDVEGDEKSLRSVIFHEVYHLNDRLDPDFGFDYQKDSQVVGQKRRREVNGLWDISIERRKLDRFGIDPFATFLPNFKGLEARDAVLQNFIRIFGDSQVIRELFEEIWDDKKGIVSHQDLTKMAVALAAEIDKSVFAGLRAAVERAVAEQCIPEANRGEILSAVDAMEQSRGPSRFASACAKFLGLIAAHLRFFGAFIPTLVERTGWIAAT